MIFTPHIIVGAVIGSKIQNIGLIVFLGLLSHFILDKVPHWDYSVSVYIKSFRQIKSLKSLIPLASKISIDGIVGLLIVFFVLGYSPFILLGIFISILPDFVLGSILFFGHNKFSKKISDFHEKFLHFKHKSENEITFLGLATEILTIIIAVTIALWL